MGDKPPQQKRVIRAMARSKVAMKYLEKKSVRKATYKKRKQCMMRKVQEISTLCGVDACVMVSNDIDHEIESWPEAERTGEIVARYKNMTKMEQVKKQMNQRSYVEERIVKAEEQLKKYQRNNHEKEVTELMYQFIGERVEGHHHNNLIQLMSQCVRDQGQLVGPAESALKNLKVLSRLAKQNLEEANRVMEAQDKAKAMANPGFEQYDSNQWWNQMLRTPDSTGLADDFSLPSARDLNNNHNATLLPVPYNPFSP